MISYIVRYNPGLNINQITEKLVDVRDKWPELIKPYGSEERQLPKGKPTRKTVSRHLRFLQMKGMVVEVGGVFLSAYDYLEKYAASLDKSVLRLLKSSVYDKWHFTPAAAVAACYTFIDPIPQSTQEFQAVTHIQQERVKESMFWLNDILRCAVISKKMSPKVISKGAINMNLLKKGWTKFFGDTRLIVFSVAIDPAEFLDFLTTSPGRVLLGQRLEKDWNQIRKDTDADVNRFGLEQIDWSEDS